MAILTWDPITRPYFAGVDKGVLYLNGSSGVAWNGLVSVIENSDDPIDTIRYRDGIRYVLPQGLEELSLKISAYTYPDAFADYSGYFDGQPRKRFGMCYRTGDSKTGQLHLIYNAVASPSELEATSKTLTTDPNLFEWDVSTRSSTYSTTAPTSHVVIDLALVYPEVLAVVEPILYGTVSTNPRLPLLTELKSIFDSNAYFRVVDNADGTWTATWYGPGPDPVISYTDATTFSITTPGAAFIDSNSYTLTNY